MSQPIGLSCVTFLLHRWVRIRLPTENLPETALKLLHYLVGGLVMF